MYRFSPIAHIILALGYSSMTLSLLAALYGVYTVTAAMMAGEPFHALSVVFAAFTVVLLALVGRSLIRMGLRHG